MAPVTYSGALGTKLIAELRDIAGALGLEVDQKKSELREAIQEFLDDNEAEYSVLPQFKGLYVRRRGRQSETDSDSADGPSVNTKSVIRSSRKTATKAVDRVKELADAAGVPLPETPVAQRVQEVATEVAAQVQEAASQALTTVQDASQALVPANMEVAVQEYVPRDVVVYAKKASGTVVRYVNKWQEISDKGTGKVRDYLAPPQNLLAFSLALELVHLLSHTSQSYNHTVFFPPPAHAETGTIGSLVQTAFGWAPKVQFTVRVPEWADVLGGGTDGVWGAVAWWLFATVIPAVVASSIFQFGAVTHKGVTTRSQAAHAQPRYDPTSFAVVRLAILLWTITSAAPDSMIDALSVAGSLQGRALWAGLTAGLVVVQKLQGAL